MKKIQAIVKLSIALLAAVAPAHSGGYWEGDYYHKVSDEFMLTEGYTRNLASGLSLTSALNISLKYQIDDQIDGGYPAYIVNYMANQTAEGDVYYSRVRSNVTQNFSKEGEDPLFRGVNAETYIIMPKKFDANQAINMYFSDENDSWAEVRASFTYDGELYEFIVAQGIINESETLDLFLYPYCPFFEGLDLDYENLYTDPVSGADFDYEGSFLMRALKT